MKEQIILIVSLISQRNLHSFIFFTLQLPDFCSHVLYFDLSYHVIFFNACIFSFNHYTLILFCICFNSYLDIILRLSGNNILFHFFHSSICMFMGVFFFFLNLSVTEICFQAFYLSSSIHSWYVL